MTDQSVGRSSPRGEGRPGSEGEDARSNRWHCAHTRFGELAAPLASTNNIHTNHGSPPRVVPVRTGGPQRPRTKQQQASRIRQPPSKRRYRAVFRQASWSQYEASCSAIPGNARIGPVTSINCCSEDRRNISKFCSFCRDVQRSLPDSATYVHLVRDAAGHFVTDVLKSTNQSGDILQRLFGRKWKARQVEIL